MLAKINGKLIFCYNFPKRKKRNNFRCLGSLAGILIGIFLLPQIAYLSNITPEKIIELTNQERLKLNLNSLTANQILTQAAYNKANDIIKTQKFQHNINDKKFSEWVRDAGYKYSYVGENLAIDFVTSEGVINAWLASPDHKKNILNPYYEEIGIAVIENKFDNENTILVAQIFGAPPKNMLQSSMIENNNELMQKEFVSQTDNYNLENLLTHSSEKILNSSFSAETNLVINPNENYKNNIGKNYFSENKILINILNQQNLLNIMNFIAISLCISSLLLISYIYFLCFSYLVKLI